MCSACGFLVIWHTENFTGDGYNHFRTVIDHNILDVELKLLTAPYIFGSAEKEYSASWQYRWVMADTHLLYQFDNLAGVETVSHYACPVEVAGYLFYFTFHAIALFVGEGQRFGWFVLDSIYYQIGKVNDSLFPSAKALFTAKPSSSFSSQWRR